MPTKPLIIVLALLAAGCGKAPQQGQEFCVSRTCVKIDNCRASVDDWQPSAVFCDVHWETGEIVQWRQGDAELGKTYQFCGRQP